MDVVVLDVFAVRGHDHEVMPGGVEAEQGLVVREVEVLKVSLSKARALGEASTSERDGWRTKRAAKKGVFVALEQC